MSAWGPIGAMQLRGHHGGTCFDCGRRRGVARPSMVGHTLPPTGAPPRPDAAADGSGACTGDALFATESERLSRVAAQYAVPVMYGTADSVRKGGLMSYSANLAVRQAGHLCRPHPKRRETGRSAGLPADQVHACHQPQDRQGARPDHPGSAVGHRGRGDPVTFPAMSTPECGNTKWLHTLQQLATNGLGFHAAPQIPSLAFDHCPALRIP